MKLIIVNKNWLNKNSLMMKPIYKSKRSNRLSLLKSLKQFKYTMI